MYKNSKSGCEIINIHPKRLISIFLIPVVAGVIGMLLLAIAFMLPTERISSHVASSVEMLKKETDYFSISPTISGSQLDNYTDALFLNQALVSHKDTDLIQCILAGYSFNLAEEAEGTGMPVETLAKVIAKPDSRILEDISKRFFNGYEVIVKALLTITDYSGIRSFNLFLGLFLALFLSYLMYKRGRYDYILPFIISLLFIRPVSVALNMTFFGFYVCMMVPCITFMFLKQKTVQKNAWWIFGITGAVTYYFNVNYIQLLSFGIPMIFYFLSEGITQKPIEIVKTVAYYLFTWIIGCVGMMVFKWIAYAVFIDDSIFKQMIDHFFLSTDIDRGSRLDAIIINSKTAFGNRWWDVIEMIFLVGNITLLTRAKKKPSISGKDITLLAI